jgi:hypothetical protein
LKNTIAATLLIKRGVADVGVWSLFSLARTPTRATGFSAANTGELINVCKYCTETKANAQSNERVSAGEEKAVSHVFFIKLKKYVVLRLFLAF